VSGGDFISRSEGAICARRGIDDRVTVVRDLQRVIARHGEAGAADQLTVSAGYLAKVVERKAEISRGLLVGMYGVAGARLASGLAAPAGIDADVARVMAAAGARPASVMTVVEAKAAVAESLRFGKLESSAVAEVPAPAPEPVVSKPPPWRRDPPDPTDAGHLMLVATLKRAVEAIGGNRQAAEYFGWGLSTLGFLKAGNRAFSNAQAEQLRAWAAANPEQDASAGVPLAADDDVQVLRGAEEVPPPALDTNSDTAVIAAGACIPPCPADMTVSAVAAAPAVPPLADVAPPPIVSTCDAEADSDAIARAVDLLQGEADLLASWCDQARMEIGIWEARRGKVMRAIEALNAVTA
jgi:hypothetical protein